MASATSTCQACGATYRGRVETCPNCSAKITAAPILLEPGQIIDGKYEILSLLGSGGMGSVFKVRHIHLHTYRTIKVMRRSLMADETYRNRFAREARLATLLNHPNVAVLYDFATLPDGSYYMISELIEGLTIAQWLARYGRFSPPLAVDIALQTLDGLEHIHRAGLLHRDLSSDNIMIASLDGDLEPVAKIIDLGIAKQVAGPAGSGETTQVGLFIGNPRYSSPEQLTGLPEGSEVDARADLYCFGVVLYEMLAGRLPFVSNSPDGYAVQHLAAPPPPLRSLSGTEGVPEGLADVVARALEKDREKRFPSAKQFAAALEPFRSDALSRTTRRKIAALRKRKDDPVERGAVPATVAPSSSDLEEHAAFERAVAEATSDALQQFLREHPNGANAAAAYARLDELNALAAVERMREHGDISSLSRLATAHGKSTFVGGAARAALDRIATQTAPEPVTARAQRALAETEAFDLASLRGDVEAWTQFVTEHPDSQLAAVARRKLATANEPLPEPPPPWPPAARAPWPLPFRLALEGGVLIAAALTVFSIVAAAQRDADTTVRPPPAIAPAIQQLLVDAVPWATVVSIRGKGREWIDRRDAHTPLQIDLPPGDYVVLAVAPDGKARKSLPAKLTKTVPAVLRFEFRAIDVDEYFAQQ